MGGVQMIEYIKEKQITKQITKREEETKHHERVIC